MRGELAKENMCALIMCIVSKEEIKVEEALKKFGVGATSAAKGVKKENLLILKDDDLEAIKNLYYNENMTMPQIAKVYKVSVGTVANYMKNHGLKARTSGWGYYNRLKNDKGGVENEG